MDSLWGEAFNLPETKQAAKKIKSKINKAQNTQVSVTKQVKSKNLSLELKLELITKEVTRILGGYASRTRVIRDFPSLVDYVDRAIQNGAVALDTETNNSLKPLECKLMGVCLYTPNQDNVYIPVNHVDWMTKQRLDWQLTETQVGSQLSRLLNTNIIMHNGKFDYQVVKCTTGVELPIYWDTMVGAKILDENELSAGLKQQFIGKIDPSVEKYSISHLFDDVPYEAVDPELFALYAATDPYMTYKLYEWQLARFTRPENSRLYDLFRNVEMPVVQVTAEMELVGVCFDTEYSERLGRKYTQRLEDVDRRITQELSTYSSKIQAWRLTPDATTHPVDKDGNTKKSKSEQLPEDINVASPVQLAILLYDVLGCGVVDKKSPRGTGEEILQKINLPICNLILERRAIVKLRDTYVDKLRRLSDESIDGRIRCHFSQLGAATGRYSSSDPNLQNIPSHEYAIRMMFCADDGKVLVGGDYSQQEPRILSQFSQDSNMIDAYIQGKDLYAVMASSIYHNNYEDNLEEYADGTTNVEGTKRRSNTKSLLLGIMYGRGIVSIAEQIKPHDGKVTDQDLKEAKEIQSAFFASFPNVKTWIDESEAFAKQYGYVEDLCGRRRRLPDIQLPRYEISLSGSSGDFNPLLGSKGVLLEHNKLVQDIQQRLNNARTKQEVDQVKAYATQNGARVKDNTGYIAQAERQSVNARIQGSAASMSKKAMIKVHNDPLMKQLGFRLCIVVHDELIGECPEENADAVKKRLSELMIEAALPECAVPMKCDTESFKRWYERPYSAERKKEYSRLLEKGLTSQAAFNTILRERSELTPEQLEHMLSN